MTWIINWQVGWWEATRIHTKKADNEFGAGSSEETIKKHLGVLTCQK